MNMSLPNKLEDLLRRQRIARAKYGFEAELAMLCQRIEEVCLIFRERLAQEARVKTYLRNVRPISVLYELHVGELRHLNIIPLRIWYGKKNRHPHAQWFITAWQVGQAGRVDRADFPLAKLQWADACLNCDEPLAEHDTQPATFKSRRS